MDGGARRISIRARLVKGAGGGRVAGGAGDAGRGRGVQPAVRRAGASTHVGVLSYRASFRI